MDILELLKYLLIGIIQGFTEPLPVSSSAHMLIAGYLFQLKDLDLNFEIIIHFASMCAIAFYFRKDIGMLIRNLFAKTPIGPFDRKYALTLVMASIPAGVAGILLKDLIDEYFMTVSWASLCLILTSVILFYSSYTTKRYAKTMKSDITIFDSIVIGSMQACALLPGISRSGSTLFGGVSRNIRIKDSLKFSFFLYLIASFGAFFLSLSDIHWSTFFSPSLIVAFIGALVATFFAIQLFFKTISSKSLFVFACYCFIIGVFFFFLTL